MSVEILSTAAQLYEESHLKELVIGLQVNDLEAWRSLVIIENRRHDGI